MTKTFRGYVRPSGRVGVRNYVLIISIMDNANAVARRIASAIRGAVAIAPHFGRGQLGQDYELMVRTLVGLGTNPNVAGVVVISLEPVAAQEVAHRIHQAGSRVEAVSFQEVGGTIVATERGIRLACQMAIEASAQVRQEMPLSYLCIGVECGGSDTTSGLLANPTIGRVADYLVDAGGRVIISETPEFIGAESVFTKRVQDERVAADLAAAIRRYEDDARARGVDMRGANPGPDNIAGGLTTIEEKSLGAIAKAGTHTIQGVLAYSQVPPLPGLWVMDTPSPAVESMTALAGGGAQVILFGTGRCNTAGSPVAPTIKVTGNPYTAKHMVDNIDVDVSSVLLGKENIEAAAERLLNETVVVASGKWVKAEALGEVEVAISRMERSA